MAPACHGPWGQGTELTGSAISAQHTAINCSGKAAVLLTSNCRVACVPMAACVQATVRAQDLRGEAGKDAWLVPAASPALIAWSLGP